MSKVIAAVDNGVAARPVVAAARALREVLGSGAEAVHVAGDGDDAARAAAEAGSIPYRSLSGNVVDSLVGAADAEDVVAVVIGARTLPTDPRPLGATALAVATRLFKPVVLVPPDARPPEAFRRVLVPLEGNDATSLAPRSLIELAAGAKIDVVALHVLDADTIPRFTDQPQHEQPAWAREFLARYCPWGIDSVELETRVGEAAGVVADAARQCGCDLIALGWAQELELGRAPVVRAALTASHVPVMLVPVRLVRDAKPAFGPAAARA